MDTSVLLVLPNGDTAKFFSFLTQVLKKYHVFIGQKCLASLSKTSSEYIAWFFEMFTDWEHSPKVWSVSSKKLVVIRRSWKRYK